MIEREVRMVTLPAMRVAAAHGYGPSPEALAWTALLDWARPAGLLDRPHRFFGFNNPMPTAGSPNYGYEQWIALSPESVPADPPAPIEIKNFAGGLYAVTRCRLPEIGQAWQELVIWRENSRYTCASHQWLEEAITPPETPFDEFVLDIYLPVAE